MTKELDVLKSKKQRLLGKLQSIPNSGETYEFFSKKLEATKKRIQELERLS